MDKQSWNWHVVYRGLDGVCVYGTFVRAQNFEDAYAATQRWPDPQTRIIVAIVNDGFTDIDYASLAGRGP